jgi:hypothetical protein
MNFVGSIFRSLTHMIIRGSKWLNLRELLTYRVFPAAAQLSSMLVLE